MIRRWVKFSLLFVLVGVTSCGTAEPAGDDVLTVVVTTTILGDVVGNVVGQDAVVEVLTPVGADPHDFQPSSAQVARLHRADLVVSIGLGLEEGLEDVLASAEADGVLVLETAPMLDPLPFHADHDEDHSSLDPHVWLDPLRMAETARLVAARLAELEPNIDWTTRAEDYAAELAAADDEVVSILSAVPDERRRLVTNHDSMGYFADRYGFEIIGVVIPGGSTLGDPSSVELAELIDLMTVEGTRSIFVETTKPSVLAEAVSSELGEDVSVVDLYTGSLGEPGSGAETLITMLLANAERIAEALGD